MSRIQKKDRVSSIVASLKDQANFAVIQFDKFSHKSFEELKRDLKKANARVEVLKNSLFEKAINQLSSKDNTYRSLRKSFFPVAHKSALLTFQNEWIEGLKAYYKLAKENEFLSYKFGLLDSIAYNADDLTKLSQLPSKLELRAKLIGCMKQPMMRTVRSITSPMQSFVYILSQKAQQGEKS